MSDLLSRINQPEDIKDLTYPELNTLAREMREFVIDTVTRVGGHLASSLGVVELTLALHRIYDSPRDVMIWDVGHQAYIHKIITGRREQLPTIRQYGGIAGFLSRKESRHDHFGAGHASTSISSALGFAMARDLNKDDNHVIAIIGDGAMTGGLAFEALNNAGQSKSNILVILNDNQMSISENVGALSSYFTEIATSPLFVQLRDKVWDFAGILPVGTRSVRHIGRKIEGSVKNLVHPRVIFDDLGFKYYGPVDGHNVEALETVMKRLKQIDGPKLLHVRTIKGKGMDQAENNPVQFHGVSGKIKPATEKPETGPVMPSYNQVLASTLIDLARGDRKITAITAAMAEGTGLVKFQSEFPERFFDVGIAEGHGVTFAAGLAAAGMKPVVGIYSTFLQRAYDQIIHDVDLQNLPVVFALDRAGLVGQDGATHHGLFDIPYLASVPNMTVTAPRNGNEFRNLLYTALQDNLTGPFAIRYPKDSVYELSEHPDYQKIPMGSWEVLSRGEDLAILAVGAMVKESLRAVPLLQDAGLSAEVVNCRFIKPMDKEMLQDLAARHHTLIIIEEGSTLNGFGSMVADLVYSQYGYHGALMKMGIADVYVEHGSRRQLLELQRLDAPGIAGQVAGFMNINLPQTA